MSSRKSSVSIVYKSSNFSDCNEPQDFESFSGFQIIRERGKLSYIRELQDGIEITSIKFRPTQIPTILKAQYGNYFEERYNGNTISSKCHLINGDLEGEYRKYSPDGTCIGVKFFCSGVDVTQEIIDFLKLNCTVLTIHEYKFTEEEEFVLMVRYGSHFKFYYEYNIDSSTFDNIVLNCL